MSRAANEIILASFAVVAIVALARCGNEAKAHDKYGEWKSPASGVSCCNERVEHADGHVTGDCRPTRSYMGDDGLWRAWNGHKWLTVPTHAVLPTDMAKDGRSHLCEINEHVICFTPAEPKI